MATKVLCHMFELLLELPRLRIAAVCGLIDSFEHRLPAMG